MYRIGGVEEFASGAVRGIRDQEGNDGGGWPVRASSKGTRAGIGESGVQARAEDQEKTKKVEEQSGDVASQK